MQTIHFLLGFGTGFMACVAFSIRLSIKRLPHILAKDKIADKAYIAVNIWACRKSGKWDETGFSEAMDDLHRASAKYLALDQEESK